MKKIALLHTGIRLDEKLIIEAAEKRRIHIELVNFNEVILDPQQIDYWLQFDCLLERCVSTVKGNAAIEFFSNLGLRIVNNKQIMNICNDKFQTSTILTKHKVPHLKSILVFGENQVRQAVDMLGGYPVVIKSREGSWGRFVSKVNDEDSLEAIFDLRCQVGVTHQAHIVQKYISKKNNRDIRAATIDGKVVAAIYRTTEHWITNTARGAKATYCPIDEDLQNICKMASDAVGGGILGIDVFETDTGYIINEINHTMEYKNVQAATGINIADKILDFCVG